jgi:hypothetical protein
VNVILYLIAAWLLANALVVVLLARRKTTPQAIADEPVSRQQTASVSGDLRKQA